MQQGLAARHTLAAGKSLLGTSHRPGWFSDRLRSFPTSAAPRQATPEPNSSSTSKGPVEQVLSHIFYPATTLSGRQRPVCGRGHRGRSRQHARPKVIWLLGCGPGFLSPMTKDIDPGKLDGRQES